MLQFWGVGRSVGMASIWGPAVTVMVMAMEVAVAERPLMPEDLRVAPWPDPDLGDYQGERDTEGRREGRGNLTWGDGSAYSGSWSAGQMQGEGVLLYMVGDYQARYDGAWLAGKQVRGVGREWDGAVCRRATGPTSSRMEGCTRESGRTASRRGE